MKSKPFQPMLAADVFKGVNLKDRELVYEVLASKLPWPLLGSPKIDGYRAIIQGRLLSRQLKAIRNERTQAHFGVAWDWAQGADGEMTVGPPHAPDVFRKTSSGITSFDGEPLADFWVFDTFNERHVHKPFEERHYAAGQVVKRMKEEGLRAKLVSHTLLKSPEELVKYERKCLEMGFEGVMVRDPAGPYKPGRATLIEGWLTKVKRFIDDEARIVGFREQMHNANELTTNERGYAKRSSHKANKHGKGTFGSFECLTRDGIPFNCGSGKGLTADERDRIWAILMRNPDEIVGRKWLKFSHFSIGAKEAPRFPKYIALLDEEDVPK